MLEDPQAHYHHHTTVHLQTEAVIASRKEAEARGQVFTALQVVLDGEIAFAFTLEQLYKLAVKIQAEEFLKLQQRSKAHA